MGRIFIAIVAAAALLSACATTELETAPDPIGDFRLGDLLPRVSPSLTQGPVSRTATPEEWEAAMTAAFEQNFRRFSGARPYHIGFLVEGYVLAQPGVPVVLSPKSALIFSVNVGDVESGELLTKELVQFTVLETVSAGNVFGSGLTKDKEAQMAELAANAAKRVESWLREQPWFDGSRTLQAAGEASAEPSSELPQ
ncbi:MAG: hypothetical protein AAF092_16265 [Pseudomonadota bacterium]